MNSVLIFWLGHMLQIRSCVILQKPESKVIRLQVWFGFRLFLVFASWLLSPFISFKKAGIDVSYPFVMTCTPILYPYRFLAIFAIDFFSASVDMVLMIMNPSYFNSRERLRYAR